MEKKGRAMSFLLCVCGAFFFVTLRLLHFLSLWCFPQGWLLLLLAFFFLFYFACLFRMGYCCFCLPWDSLPLFAFLFFLSYTLWFLSLCCFPSLSSIYMCSSFSLPLLSLSEVYHACPSTSLRFPLISLAVTHRLCLLLLFPFQIFLFLIDSYCLAAASRVLHTHFIVLI